MVQQTDKLVLRYTSIEEQDYFWSCKMLPVKCNGKYGFIDVMGYEVIPCQYEGYHYFSEGMAAVKKNGKWALSIQMVK